MEADWSVEIGAGLPWIVVPWHGVLRNGEEISFVDLRGADAASIELVVNQLPFSQSQAAAMQTLTRALLALNAAQPAPPPPVFGSPGLPVDRSPAFTSPVFTAKCDVWELTAHQIDPLEFEADPDVRAGFACYIDIVFHNTALFASFESQERWMRRTTSRFRALPLRSARLDLVLRRAEVFGVEGYAITLYVMGCGADPAAAETAWNSAVSLTAAIVCDFRALG